ncbi:MAG: glycoside hydrolase family 3 N-terminal domain-containing protein [Tannerellaceae bacterium]
MNLKNTCKQIALITVASLSGLSAIAQPKADIYHDTWTDFNKNGKKDLYEDPAQPVASRVANLLSQMTLEEKSCQLATLYGYRRVLKDSLPTEQWKQEIWKDGIANIDEQLNGVGSGYKRAYSLIYPYSNHVEAKNKIQRWFIEETRLGIPVDFTNEGIHGLNHTKATPLPAPIAVGSTWNRALVRQAGEIVGKEAKLLGYSNVYAPILDVARDPRWGRILECYGEDPFLIAEMGVQMVKGIQSKGVGSTLKHFAVYSVPKGGRDAACRTDPHVTPRELHEMHLYPFRRVIQEASPMGVMSSYNDWDGVPITASHYFLTQLLRNEYGFTGYVVSDSEAVEFVHSKHHTADSYDDAVRQVLEAGLNVRTNFTLPANFILPVRRLVAENKLSMATVDRRVSEVLSVKFRLGLFDTPYVKNPKEADKQAGADKHPDFVMDMQRQSLILLKNAQNLLPLDKKQIRKVLVTGPLADEDNFMVSRYGPNGLPTVTVLKGLQKYLKGAAEVTYSKGCHVVDANWPDSELVPTPLTADEEKSIQKAVAQAKESDVVIAVMGEDEYRTGESRSRTSLDLPGRQQQLLEALHKTGKPVVLVLINGQPLTINWADRNIPAILETWFPSYLGGQVIAETLFGENNPGGKLTVTFPKSVGQIELNFPYKKGSHGGQYGSGPNGSGSTRVLGSLYPFGHGLSYTTFSYANLHIEAPAKGTQGTVNVSFDVTNTGKRTGDEVAQLYIQDKVSSVVTYDSQLRNFERITLAPGETKTVRFTLEPSDLQLLDKDMHWTVEPGTFEVRIGSSSEDIRLKDDFELLN